MISHELFFDFIVNAVDKPETPPPTMTVSLTASSSVDARTFKETARCCCCFCLPRKHFFPTTAKALLVVVDDVFFALPLFPIENDEDLLIVVIIVF
jgi:hypothetical protein